MITTIGHDLSHVIALLQEGNVVALPTETVYGLAADANNDEAILKIFSAKNRPSTNPLILHFATLEQAYPYVSNFPVIFNELANHFCPGPLTFIVPRSSLVSDLVTGGQSSVAIRFPDHPLFVKLIENLNGPIAAPSANLYGQLSPTNSDHVYEQLAGRIPYILEGGACQHGLESTIIGLVNKKVVIYRHGGITTEALSTVLGYVPQTLTQEQSGILTSGMVRHHYATQTPLFLGFKPQQENQNALQITLTKNEQIIGPHYVLSDSSSLLEAARNLYAVLHQADKQTFKKIYIEPFPNEGLGKAMNDRLNRAAAKFSNH